MPELRVLIVDDEPLARRGIRQLLDRHADVRVLGEARHGAEAVQMMRACDPNVVFLDIEMPGLDGFGVLQRSIAERGPLVIFVTAHEEYALPAFDVAATDYLMKPVARARFDASLDRVREALDGRNAAGRGPDGALPDGLIRVGSPGGEILLRPEEIDWVEAADYYAAIHAGDRRYLLRESLTSLQGRLPAPTFARVHRSAIVNLGRVERFVTVRGGGGRLVLRSGTEVPVSRRMRAAVRRRLEELGRRG